jgi:hypothetical protein
MCLWDREASYSAERVTWPSESSLQLCTCHLISPSGASNLVLKSSELEFEGKLSIYMVFDQHMWC